jgi:hypothetical protein
MATATCKTVLGLLSVSEPFKLRSSTCVTIAGIISVAGRVPWVGSTAKPKDVNWIPLPTVKVLNDNGTMSRPWYLFFKEIADHRLGGISAESVPQVAVKQDQVNAYLVDVQAGVTGMGIQVSAITETVNTQTEVAQTNALSGSAQISRLPSYKQAQLGILNQ